MKKIRLALAAFSLIAFSAVSASAFVVVDNTAGGTKTNWQQTNTINFNVSNWKVFTFTTPNTSTQWILDAVTTGIYAPTTTINPTITWNLYKTDGVNLTSASLASSSLAITGLSTTRATYYTTNFTGAGWMLDANTQYALALSSNLATRSATFTPTALPVGTSGFLFNGQYVRTAGTALTLQNSGSAFELQASAVPEPSTYLLLAVSLGVIGYARKRMNATRA